MSGHSMMHELRRRNRAIRGAAVLGIGLFLWHSAAQAKAAAQAPATDTPVVITLDEAIKRAQANEPAFAAAIADSQSAALDRSIARAGLLPTARLYSQDIYTEPNGTFADNGEGVPSANPKFVANDSRPREYMAQGIAEETLSVAGLAALRRADAAAAMARAELEIARRGLAATVTGLFYGSLAADNKAEIAQRAYQEAKDFHHDHPGSREARRGSPCRRDQGATHGAGTMAACLRMRLLVAQTARLDLGVLLFSDPRTAYTLQAPQAVPPLAPIADVEAAAAKYSPEMKSALANLDATNADVLGARGALMPTLDLNVIYGIDASQFAVNGPVTSGGVQARNLGYSTSVTVNIPVWDWLSTEHKLKQSEMRRDAARVSLTNTQRRMIADLQSNYAAAQTAQEELDSLDSSVATAAESLRLSELRYKSGEALVLEVVDAQNAYVAAEDAREDGYVRYQNALATLQTLTGTM